MKTNRITVSHTSPLYDVPATRIKKNNDFMKIAEITEVRSANSYLLQGDFSESQIENFATKLFTDSQIEKSYINCWPEFDFDYAVEIGFKAGVTDNVAKSTRDGIEDLMGRALTPDELIATSHIFFFKTKIEKERLDKIIGSYLYNALIERHEILSKNEFNKSPFKNEIPQFHFSLGDYYETIDLELSDSDLIRLSTERVLALTLEEMKSIRDYYRREDVTKARKEKGLPEKPTDVELEVLAQTWSEHCKHKIFAADVNYIDENNDTQKIKSIYKTFIKDTTNQLKAKRKDLLSVFSDNAGVVQFDENFAYCIKAETHNSPSALDPYGGAMTGIVGVNRDIIGTGIGAKPIFNTDVFCFADPFYKKEIPSKLLHPRRIFEGVHRGVKDGGNESGIPTVNGAIVFDDRFLGKPLVFCGTGGIMPLKINGANSWEKRIEPGDLIVMTGGRIGKDGIHGATFSSVALTEASPTSAVQIGDPITQKKMLDFLIEARDKNLYKGITDNGAGGLSSSLGEMATFPGGCIIELDKAPLKYDGLMPWEILVSEAQERMSLSVSKDTIEAFLQLAKDRSVEAVVIGVFTDTPVFEAKYKEVTVCRIDMSFMHEGLPTLSLNAIWKKPSHPEPSTEQISKLDISKTILQLLSRPNVASKEYWVRQYDHEVQGGSVVKPFTGLKGDGPSDAAVVRPVYGTSKGLVISNGILPRMSDIDTFHMAQHVVDEALRALVATGGNPDTATGLDNFCWPDPVQATDNPRGEYKMAQLVRANKGLQEICLAYEIPLVSGKDSMKNDYGRGESMISVPPTLLFTAITTINNVKLAMTTDFKKPGNLIYHVGLFQPELGGSELFAMLGFIGNTIPPVVAKKNLALYRKIYQLMQNEEIQSCHDISDGGLAITLCEMAIGGKTGAEVDLSLLKKLTISNGNLKTDEKLNVSLLFGEAPGRFIVEISPEDQSNFEKTLGNDAIFLGTVTSEPTVKISTDGKESVNHSLQEIEHAWKTPLQF